MLISLKIYGDFRAESQIKLYISLQIFETNSVQFLPSGAGDQVLEVRCSRCSLKGWASPGLASHIGRRVRRGAATPGHEGGQHLLVAVLAHALGAQEHVVVVVGARSARPRALLLVEVQEVIAGRVVDLGQRVVLALLGQAV